MFRDNGGIYSFSHHERFNLYLLPPSNYNPFDNQTHGVIATMYIQ